MFVIFELMVLYCLIEVEDTQNRIAFVDGGTVLKIPLFYLEGIFNYIV